MTPEQQALYQRICDFKFDPPGAQFRFCDKLAKENGWSAEFTQRVMDEYRRFAFLAVVAGHPISPSDAVDQVWHMHMLYTQSYWEEFCPKVLRRPFHHYPSQGGDKEQAKLHDWYERTLQSYQTFFAEPPPPDIWQSPEQHKPEMDRFVRINLNRYRLVPIQIGEKTPATTFLQPDGHLASVEQLSTNSSAIYRNAKLPKLSLYEAAYLAGKEKNVAAALIGSLLQRRNLKYHAEFDALLPDRPLSADPDPLEHAVLEQFAQNGKTKSYQLWAKLAAELKLTRKRLIDKKLLNPYANLRGSLLVGVVGLLLLLALINTASLYFTFLIAIFSIIAIFRITKLTPTAEGERVLSELQYSLPTKQPDSQSALDESLLWRTAVYGMAAWVGSDIGFLEPMLNPIVHPNGSGCGGGGCGGGGCGG